MQSSHELFYEEFAVRFLIFFKEMATFCEQFVQKQHQPSSQPIQRSRNFKSNPNNIIVPNNQQVSRRRKDLADPDAPKRPLSSFILFYRDKMQEYQNKNPSLSMTENTKVIGKVWNSLSEEERNQYKQRAQNLKEEYEREYTAYAQRKGIAIPKKKFKKAGSNNNKVELILDDDEEEDNNNNLKEGSNNNNNNPIDNNNDDELEIQEINQQSPKQKEIIEVEFDDQDLSDSDDDDDDDEDENVIEMNEQVGNQGKQIEAEDSDSDDSEDDSEVGNKVGKATADLKKKKLLTDDDDSEEEFQIQKKVKQK